MTWWAKLRWPYQSQLEAISNAIDRLYTNVQRIADEVGRGFADGRRRPVPEPFVCALAIGELEDGTVATAGASGHADKSGHILLELDTHRRLQDVNVIVFCDLQHVVVHGIFRGVDLMHVALGTCPFAHVPDWEPGVKLRIQAVKRRDE